jgi:mono/diheme cytochrome c family protein
MSPRQPRKREGHEGRTKKKNLNVFFVYLRGLRVFVVSVVLASPAVSAQRAASQIDNGRQTFLRVGCYQCHGTEGQGAATGPRLGPNPLPLAQFTRAVRTPRNEMPPYGSKLLPDAELADIHAFLAARPRPHELPK